MLHNILIILTFNGIQYCKTNFASDLCNCLFVNLHFFESKFSEKSISSEVFLLNKKDKEIVFIKYFIVQKVQYVKQINKIDKYSIYICMGMDEIKIRTNNSE